MFYLIIASIICLISGHLFKLGCGTLSLYRPNMMTVIFYYYLILQCVIGAVLIANNWEKSNWELQVIVNPNVRIYGFWVIMYTMIAFPFGMLCANSLLRQKYIKSKFIHYCDNPIRLESIGNCKIIKYCLIVLSIISGISVLYVIRTIGEIGLLKVFNTESAAELAGFRISSGREFAGNQFIRGFFALYLCPLMCYVAYGYKKIVNSIFNRCWFWSLFVGSVLILTSNLEKAPLIVFLIGFVFFRIYTGKILSKRLLLVLFIGACTLIALIYILVMKTGTEDLFTGILNRLTISSVGGLYLDLDIFPSRHNFLGFSSFSQEVNAFFCQPHNERSARIAMMFAQPDLVASGEAGVINCLFTGEAWANWGWFGLIFSPIYVGFIIQLFYIVFINLKKTPLFLGIMVKYSFTSVIVGGVNDYLYNTSVRWLIMLCVVIVGVSQIYHSTHVKCRNSISGDSYTR